MANAPSWGLIWGGTNMQAGVAASTAPGAFRSPAREKKKTKAEQGLDAVVDRTRGSRAACDAAAIPIAAIDAVGIALESSILSSGVVVEAVNLRWNEAPLAAMLKTRIGVPVLLDNDVNAAVLGEHRGGAARPAACVGRLVRHRHRGGPHSEQ